MSDEDQEGGVKAFDPDYWLRHVGEYEAGKWLLGFGVQVFAETIIAINTIDAAARIAERKLIKGVMENGGK